MELRSPIRLYWDLTPTPEHPPDYDHICTQIESSRALVLHLTDLGEVLNPEIARIVTRLSVSIPVLSVTVASTAAPEAVSLRTSGVKNLYVDVPSPDVISSCQRPGISGISFRTSRSNHHLLPDSIAGCLENGIAELQLPMERLNAGDAPLCLTTEERELLAARIAQIPFAGRLTVTANDPFLWRVVHPDSPFPDGICQAANTMLAIAPNGNVYPCPALPLLLGNLHHADYHEIIASALKKSVRKSILDHPTGCSGCPLLAGCRGGCRGRGFHVAGRLDAADPGCGGRENVGMQM